MTSRETYEKKTGEKVTRWDGVFDPAYVEFLEEQNNQMIKLLRENNIKGDYCTMGCKGCILAVSKFK
jgi:hypothetical protein